MSRPRGSPARAAASDDRTARRGSPQPGSSALGASSSGGSGGSSSADSSYAHLRATHASADSSSDDEVDPRFTHPKVAAAAAAARAQGSSASPLAPTARRTGGGGGDTQRRSDGGATQRRTTSSSSRANFTRTGYAPTPSPITSSYVNTSGSTGTTPRDAEEVQQQWSKGIGTLDAQKPREGSKQTSGGVQDTSDSTSFYSGIPAPQVDLAGMTDEQRELLEYLQARVESFERERVDFLQRLDEMAGSSTERHGLKWEVHRKDEQIMDLQKALSDAHVFLYEERAQVLKLTAENDRLKIQELEDRHRLEHLLALTQPINQEVTYFRECRPEKLTKAYPGTRDDIYASQRDMSDTTPGMDSPRRQVFNTTGAPLPNNAALSGTLSHSGSASQFGSQSVRGARGSTRPSTAAGAASKKRIPNGLSSNASALRPVVRTIYLPNENIDILKQIIASLRSQLQEQHTLFEQRIQALQEDRAIREQETAEVQRKARAHIQELADELKALNEMNKMTTRDYLELRHAAQLNERKLKEKASSLSQQSVDLARHLQQVEGKAAGTVSDLQTENAQYVSLFRQQTAATEEDLAIMKAQYAATQDLYEKRIRYLEGRITTLKAKVRTVDERRSLELQGYTSDVRAMKLKLRKVEQALLSFKVEAMATNEPEALQARDEDRQSNSPNSQRQRALQKMQQSQRRGASQGTLPARSAAGFAMVEDEVERMQRDLADITDRLERV